MLQSAAIATDQLTGGTSGVGKTNIISTTHSLVLFSSSCSGRRFTRRSHLTCFAQSEALNSDVLVDFCCYRHYHNNQLSQLPNEAQYSGVT